MKRVLCLVTLVLLATFAFPQTSNSTGQSGSTGQTGASSGDEQQLLSLEQQWATAMTSGDVATVQRIEADNYVMNGSDGTTITKQQDISGMKSGTEKYTEAQLSDLKATVNGDTGTVTGKIALKGTENGKDVSGAYQFTDTFQKRDGSWQAVSTKSTNVPE